MEENLEAIAVAETWENGKPVRETLAADIPLAIDHFRYFAGVLRAQEGGISQLDEDTVGVPLPGAARCGRPDHPLELPDPDGDVEARSGARGRQLRRAQARRADARVDPVPARHHRRPDPGRRAEHRQRLRNRGGRAARVAQEDPQGRVHGRDHDRAPDHAVRVAEPHPGHARARRQEPERLLRRRRTLARLVLRQGARGLLVLRPQSRRGLHVPVARAHPAVDLRPAARRRHRARARQSSRATRSIPTR